MTGGFSIEEERLAQGHRLVLDGELDLAAAYDLETALSRLCGEGPIELDLRKVTFMDSMGMRSLLTARDMCTESGIQPFRAGRRGPAQDARSHRSDRGSADSAPRRRPRLSGSVVPGSLSIARFG